MEFLRLMSKSQYCDFEASGAPLLAPGVDVATTNNTTTITLSNCSSVDCLQLLLRYARQWLMLAALQRVGGGKRLWSAANVSSPGTGRTESCVDGLKVRLCGRALSDFIRPNSIIMRRHLSFSPNLDARKSASPKWHPNQAIGIRTASAFRVLDIFVFIRIEFSRIKSLKLVQSVH
jgi:hypothetical protein